MVADHQGRQHQERIISACPEKVGTGFPKKDMRQGKGNLGRSRQ
jgi:hypothetical protein